MVIYKLRYVLILKKIVPKKKKHPNTNISVIVKVKNIPYPQINRYPMWWNHIKSFISLMFVLFFFAMLYCWLEFVLSQLKKIDTLN